jgi:dTDP-4-dehydrorhamnose reductase
MKVLLTGGSGFIGEQLIKPLGRLGNVFAPYRAELDITQNAEEYITRIHPDVIVHAAAFTNADLAEKERGDREGDCWKINVEGTKKIVEAAKKVGSTVIYISTGSVFSGTTKESFKESDPPSFDERLSWYAITKKEAEKLVVHGCIIRISHPAISRVAVSYPLFTDQFYPLTLISDLAHAISVIIEKKKKGIFHVASVTMCSPYELGMYVTGKSVEKTTFKEFIKTVSHPLRYSQYHAIDSGRSIKALGLPARRWQEVCDINIHT